MQTRNQLKSGIENLKGVKNHKVKPSKYYIVSTDIIQDGNYCLINKEFNSPKDAQKVIDHQLHERRFYNTIINGKIAEQFGFKFKKTNSGKPSFYYDVTKYIYPEGLEPNSHAKQSFRTKQRRQWRAKQLKRRMSQRKP